MNLKSKLLLALFIVLCGAIVSQFFYYKSELSDKDNEIVELKTVKIKNLEEERDLAFDRIDTITTRSKRRFDSIANIPPTIKWKVYEKPVYPNRTLGDALDVHAEYKANTRAETKN